MDFFDQQTRAQSKTRLLIVYFVLAVIGIIAAIQGVAALIFSQSYTDLEMLAWVSGGVAATVLLGSLTKMAELSQGGRVVAAMLGGEPVLGNTVDPDERKLLNIIEEMSLASGVPVPEVFVLPDPSINAFAAGHGPGDTAIGVTRGCIAQLTRDELQGVIAHEYSHILHGDMKLNIRLMGLLNGILGIAFIGGALLRFGVFTPSSRRSRDDKGGGLAFALMAGGIGLYLIGWIGVFFGNLIKAAVSRQREFLADASAVQYTRNPGGIAGALWKIGQFASKLSSPRAQEASHLFFGNGVGESWLSLFATHPPLDERISAIDGNFDPAQVREVRPPPQPGPKAEPSARRGLEAIMPGMVLPGMGFSEGLSQGSLEQAQSLLAGLPVFVAEAVRDLHGGCAFIYAMLLDEDAERRQAQLNGFGVEETVRREMMTLFARRNEIAPDQRLPLVDLVMPTLRQLSPDQYKAFRANVRHLVESDQRIHLFEYALQKSLLRHLELYFSKSTGPKVKYRGIVPLLPDVGALLTGLAVLGNDDPVARDEAFAAGVRELLVKSSLTRGEACDLAAIDAGLDRLAQSSPDVKRTVLKACRETVTHDGVVDLREYELLRAIADNLDAPMPPLPPVQSETEAATP